LHSVNNKTKYKPTGKYLVIHGRLKTPHPNMNLNTTKGRSYTDTSFKGEHKTGNSKTLSRKKRRPLPSKVANIVLYPVSDSRNNC
jgi:hypothetical protein